MLKTFAVALFAIAMSVGLAHATHRYKQPQSGRGSIFTKAKTLSRQKRRLSKGLRWFSRRAESAGPILIT